MGLLSMLESHPFWALLTCAVLVWYSTITIYVAIRGALDIKHLLRTLKPPVGPKPGDPDQDQLPGGGATN